MKDDLGKRVTDSLLLYGLELMFQRIKPPVVADFSDWTRFIFLADTLAYNAAHAVMICDIFVDRGILNCTCSGKSEQGIVCCDCPHQCDYDDNGFLDSVDMSVLIDVIYAGGTDIQDPTCPTTRGDFNGEGFPDSVDLVLLIDHLFAGGPGPADPCNP
jgi:hypothetical protein